MSLGNASDVAVIIAAFNAESTLSSALSSVAGQVRKPGSVVVVDDGSSDATLITARAWQDRLPLRVVSHEQNMGLASARRTAIEATVEPLIAVLDSDDVWLPDHLEALRSAYAANPGLVTADALYWMPGQGVSRFHYRSRCPIPELRRQRTAILESNFVFIGAMFTREAYLRVGGFRDGILGAEDWDLWIRMLRAGEVVFGTQYPTVLYRLHSGGLSWGKQQLENETQVLKTALAEIERQDERIAARRGLGRLRARLGLVRAYELARAGDATSARRAAAGALGGPWSVSLRALTMMVAPRAGVRYRDKKIWEPSVRLA